MDLNPATKFASNKVSQIGGRNIICILITIQELNFDIDTWRWSLRLI